jgi:hypothetical protein
MFCWPPPATVKWTSAHAALFAWKRALLAVKTVCPYAPPPEDELEVPDDDELELLDDELDELELLEEEELEDDELELLLEDELELLELLDELELPASQSPRSEYQPHDGQ